MEKELDKCRTEQYVPGREKSMCKGTEVGTHLMGVKRAAGLKWGVGGVQWEMKPGSHTAAASIGLTGKRLGYNFIYMWGRAATPWVCSKKRPRSADGKAQTMAVCSQGRCRTDERPQAEWECDREGSRTWGALQNEPLISTEGLRGRDSEKHDCAQVLDPDKTAALAPQSSPPLTPVSSSSSKKEKKKPLTVI